MKLTTAARGCRWKTASALRTSSGVRNSTSLSSVNTTSPLAAATPALRPAADPGAEAVGQGEGEPLPQLREAAEAAGVAIERRRAAVHEVAEDPRQRVGRGPPLALELERARVAERAPEIERAVTLLAAEA